MIILNVTDEDGTLLDRVEVERADFVKAQGNMALALMLIEGIAIGDEGE